MATDVACAQVVVYDASCRANGRVRFVSPNRSLINDINADGTKADFKFDVQYKRQRLVPAQKLKFELKKAGFTFLMTEYEWLAPIGTAENKAKFQGSGTVNGSGSYGFSALVVENGGSGLDTIRIQIWDKDNGDSMVYDNGSAADDDEGTTVTKGRVDVQCEGGRKKTRKSNHYNNKRHLRQRPLTAPNVY